MCIEYVLQELTELHHENVVALLDCKESPLHVFLVMEVILQFFFPSILLNPYVNIILYVKFLVFSIAMEVIWQII